MRDASSGAAPKATVAYVLKSFPRLSETFIASEIYRLERLGVDLRLFVIKRPSEPIVHPIADAIAAPRTYLPEAAPISDVSTLRWLREHAPRFAPALRRQSVRSPLRMLRAAAVAFGHAVRARKGRWALPRRSMLKEFLQAAALADAVTAAGDVRHLHAHFCHSATTVAWLAAMMSGLPLSFTAHAKDVYSPALNPAGLLARKLAAASFVVTCTRANQVCLQAQTTTPVYCIYHGLDVEFARLIGASGRRALHGGPLRALAVGRLVQKKGLDVFIDALAILRARGLALDAAIVGEEGDHGPALRAQVDPPRPRRHRPLYRTHDAGGPVRDVPPVVIVLPPVPRPRQRRSRRHPQCACRGHGMRPAGGDDRRLRDPRAARGRPERRHRADGRCGGDGGRDGEAAW